ncbi:hypothetical protein CWI36_0549p0020 [Hamiltosporidium magnivora]|uniref:Uncharacterized protein n=1 Tax=Hamiltosporidium magnivora TaxID=148818 RepID=A0A4Q9LFN0_9MICR|nr:hypothetical protein CWI36_0549p0020 [Hamiltosporidium magnivora]
MQNNTHISKKISNTDTDTKNINMQNNTHISKKIYTTDTDTKNINMQNNTHISKKIYTTDTDVLTIKLFTNYLTITILNTETRHTYNEYTKKLINCINLNKLHPDLFDLLKPGSDHCIVDIYDMRDGRNFKVILKPDPTLISNESVHLDLNPSTKIFQEYKLKEYNLKKYDFIKFKENKNKDLFKLICGINELRRVYKNFPNEVFGGNRKDLVIKDSKLYRTLKFKGHGWFFSMNAFLFSKYFEVIFRKGREIDTHKNGTMIKSKFATIKQVNDLFEQTKINYKKNITDFEIIVEFIDIQMAKELISPPNVRFSPQQTPKIMSNHTTPILRNNDFQSPKGHINYGLQDLRESRYYTSPYVQKGHQTFTNMQSVRQLSANQNLKSSATNNSEGPTIPQPNMPQTRQISANSNFKNMETINYERLTIPQPNMPPTRQISTNQHFKALDTNIPERPIIPQSNVPLNRQIPANQNFKSLETINYERSTIPQPNMSQNRQIPVNQNFKSLETINYERSTIPQPNMSQTRQIPANQNFKSSIKINMEKPNIPQQIFKNQTQPLKDEKLDDKKQKLNRNQNPNPPNSNPRTIDGFFFDWKNNTFK